MRPNRFIRVVAASLAALLGSGCSFVLVRRAPDPLPEERWVTCTENRLWPVVDVLAAAALVSPLVYIATSETNAERRTLGLVLGIPLFGAGAAAFGVSGYSGFRETSRCNEIHDEYERGLEPLSPAGT